MARNNFLISLFFKSIQSIVLLTILLYSSLTCIASDLDLGEELFTKNCVGCHVKGGNIIRRGKTLKLQALKRNGIDNSQAIAIIASQGIGSMSGYKEFLKEGEDQVLADWIWEQAQNAWVQG